LLLLLLLLQLQHVNSLYLQAAVVLLTLSEQHFSSRCSIYSWRGLLLLLLLANNLCLQVALVLLTLRDQQPRSHCCRVLQQQRHRLEWLLLLALQLLWRQVLQLLWRQLLQLLWRQLLQLLLLLRWLHSKVPPRHKAGQQLWLLSRQLALHVVLPGSNSITQQLIVLPSTQWRPGLLRGVWVLLRVELSEFQDLHGIAHDTWNHGRTSSFQLVWVGRPHYNYHCCCGVGGIRCSTSLHCMPATLFAH
jgi:hypothetical protein